MSKLALYYGRTPLEISVSELEEYLYFLVKKEDSPSRSPFKHLVYGLRKPYQLFDKEELQLGLPPISRPDKLPVVLSTQEMKRLLSSPGRIWVRVMFGLIYDAGLRITEPTNLLLGDVDLNCAQIHVRRTKNKKGRYLPISSHMVRGIHKHLTLNKPETYLFECQVRKGMPISNTRIRTLLKDALMKAGIKKQVCVHTLRHCYATHQLEAGQNIMVVKESLGHSDIRHTLVYLHIANLGPMKKFGCMDALYSSGNA